MGCFGACRYAIRSMLKNEAGGSIVNISSGAGTIGALNMDAYVASKAAMNGVTRSMAAEYARSRIRVNAIVLGLINNGGAVEAMLQKPELAASLRASIPLPLVGEPDDIAWAAVYLASDEARLHHRGTAAGRRWHFRSARFLSQPHKLGPHPL